MGHEPQHDTLEEIIAAINERFGTDLDERDRLEVEKVQMTLNADEQLKTFARANAIDNFALEFGPRFKSAILDTEAHTQRLYQVLLTNPELAKMIESEVMRSSYHAMREDPEAEVG